MRKFGRDVSLAGERERELAGERGCGCGAAGSVSPGEAARRSCASDAINSDGRERGHTTTVVPFHTLAGRSQ